jgi:hypothetical protein
MDKVLLTTSLLNTIVQYLANRPYVEVAAMIERIQTELKPKEPENGGKVDPEGN